jgi:peptide-methionine (R)-S-oxide reductase
MIVEEEVLPVAIKAITNDQLKSIAELSKSNRYSLYENITIEDRTNYFLISCRPITKRAEDDMELVSDIITWGEMYLHHWDTGIYKCSRCKNPLYSSNDKWKGPCVWPSFRQAINETLAISTTIVYPYNNYKVTVKEVYCFQCNLFIGHAFDDGILKGDVHAQGRWRH